MPVLGEVIRPRFEPISYYISESFTLIDFPITYVGLLSNQTVYVRNYSARDGVFCFMGEINNELEVTDIKYIFLINNLTYISYIM